jgi:hypothetical protein
MSRPRPAPHPGTPTPVAPGVAPPLARRALATFAAALACAGASAEPVSCPDDPRCPGVGWRAEGRAASGPGAASRPGEAALPAAGPRPSAPVPRDPGTTFDRDGRFQGSLGGRHPFDAAHDARRGGTSGR